eukprot:57136-Alexandrium_andersonii.AAC.1
MQKRVLCTRARSNGFSRPSSLHPARRSPTLSLARVRSKQYPLLPHPRCRQSMQRNICLLYTSPSPRD